MKEGTYPPPILDPVGGGRGVLHSLVHELFEPYTQPFLLVYRYNANMVMYPAGMRIWSQRHFLIGSLASMVPPDIVLS